MSEFAIHIVKESGVDVDKLVELLISSAVSELSTCYHYNLLCCNLCEYEGEDLFELAEIARIEDCNHYEALTTRIDELGGNLPANLSNYYNKISSSKVEISEKEYKFIDILKRLRDFEAKSMSEYNEICKMTYSKDFRTYDLALAILHEKTEHESWFSGYLEGEPSGQLVRQGVISPFVRKFLNE